MDENQPTTKQVILFTVVLSFVVSIMGTILTLGILGPEFNTGDTASPFFFNRPQILEKITEVIPTSGQKQEELKPALTENDMVVKAVEEAYPAVVSVVASKDVPVIEQYYVDPFADDPYFQQFFGGDSGFRIPQYRQNGTEKKNISSGTGFFVSADGLIVTNKHVVADKTAEYTVLVNDGRKLVAKILDRDPRQDLAVLKVEGENFPFLKFGDSGSIKIGQAVIAIGNALGEFRNTVSIGIISGLERSVIATGSVDGPEALQELIQTDAAINPGNSGGPLLDLKGEVIGINTAIAQGAQNIGFAIPGNKIKRDVSSVQKSGKIIYPFLGVRYAIITKDSAEKEKLGRSYGALIRSSGGQPAVIKESPAEKAGLREGDIILKINNEPVNTGSSLATILQKYQVGDEVTLRVFRDNEEIDTKAILAENK